MIDASVILAIMLDEPDALEWDAAIGAVANRFTTPTALAEVALRLENLYEVAPDATKRDIEALLSTLGIAIRDLPAASWPLAVAAIRRYGRGRHSARLNYGDCLSYSAAKHYRVALLYKGDDFAQTDVNDGY
jgi:ribonuclease VapC